MNFLFGGNTGETASSLKRKRELADAMLAGLTNRAPQNVGEGIFALAKGIRGRIDSNAANRGIAKGESGARDMFRNLLNGGSPAASQASYTPSTAPSAAVAGTNAVQTPGSAEAARYTVGNTPKVGGPQDYSGNQIYSGFMDAIKRRVTNPNGLAAIAATGRAESAFNPKNAFGQWNDPSERGVAGQSGGIMSWRAERLQNLRNFAKANGDNPQRPSPATQAQFFLQEDPKLVEALNNAGSVEEAQRLMNNAWRFAGYNRQGNSEVARRNTYASQFLPSFSGQGVQRDASRTESPVLERARKHSPRFTGKGRPIHVGEDGTPFSEKTVTVPVDGKWYTFPSILDDSGVTSSESRIIEYIRENGAVDPITKERFPSFKNVEDATKFARERTGSLAHAQAQQPPQPQQTAQTQPDPRILELLANPFATPEMKQAATIMLQQQQQASDPLRQLQLQKLQQEVNAPPKRQILKGADGFNYYQDDGSRVLPGVDQQQDPTSDIQEYQFAQNQGYQGSFFEYQQAKRKAGATSITNTVGGEPNDASLRKSLNKKTGELWSTYQEQASTSGALQQDFQVLDELIQIAPQGPVTGRLAETFKGFSSAGDAFQSIVKRIAPTLRAPGSGSTSDIEYDGMLRSLPALSNRPEANTMIAQIMKDKAALNIKRGQIVGAYAQGQITASQAQQQIGDLDKRSIMTPEMKRALAGVAGLPANNRQPAQSTQSVPQSGAIEDGYRFTGGDPGDPNNWEVAR